MCVDEISSYLPILLVSIGLSIIARFPVGQIVQCLWEVWCLSLIIHPHWSARLMLMETSCLSIIARSPVGQLRPMFMDVYYNTFSHWRNRRMFSAAMGIVLLASLPHDAASNPSQKLLIPPAPPSIPFSLNLHHPPFFRPLQNYLNPGNPRLFPDSSTFNHPLLSS